MNSEYDLDLSFDEQPVEVDLTAISASVLVAEIAKLPAALQGVASGVLVELRTMSDISQSLGIRQSELVTRLYRAKQQIAENLKG